jgi:DNA-binding Lrp family transcriptional regulator
MRDELELAPNLSDDDRSLIRLLQDDGRRSFASLAAELGRGEHNVRRRFAELQRAGVIKVTTVAAPELLGYSLTALVGITVRGDVPPSEVAGAIAETRYAFYVMVVCGQFSVLAELTCRDFEHLLETVEQDVRPVAGVSTVEIFPYHKLFYQNPTFALTSNGGRPNDAVGDRPLRFDATDQSIISMLSDDGRTPYSEVAVRLRVSESQVRQRTKRMLSSGAVRVMALTSPRGMGFEVTAIVAVRLAADCRAVDVASRLAKLPAVIYVVICAGRYDLFVELVCTDMLNLLDVLDGQVRATPGVASAEPWVYLQLHYRRVSPIGQRVAHEG